MKENTAVIEVQNLVRTFGRADAVRGLSLTVQPGRCYGFFGRNGAGKTKTLAAHPDQRGCLAALHHGAHETVLTRSARRPPA